MQGPSIVSYSQDFFPSVILETQEMGYRTILWVDSDLKLTVIIASQNLLLCTGDGNDMYFQTTADGERVGRSRLVLCMHGSDITHNTKVINQL